MLSLILEYYTKGSEAIVKGVPMVKLRRLRVVQEMARMRFSVRNDDLLTLDKLQLTLDRSIDQLGGVYEN
jgi:V/A-type H+-transporting ATPase subunit A